MAADPRYPPSCRPASDFDPPARRATADRRRRAAAAAAPAAAPRQGRPDDLPLGPIDVLCLRPLHHVMEYAALYGLAAALRTHGRRVRLFLRSALADWSPFARLPADEIGRLPEAGERAARAELLARLRAGGASCLLLGADPAWEEELAAAGLPLGDDPACEEAAAACHRLPAGGQRAYRLPLAPEFHWRLPEGAGCAAAAEEFFAALARASPRWLAAAAAPPPLAPGGAGRPPRFLVHQGRSHVGDMLWLTPLLRAISRLFPGASVTVVGSAAAALALAGNPHCTELLLEGPHEAQEADGPLAGQAATPRHGLLDRLRRQRYDAALFAFGARPRSHWLAAAAADLRIPRRIDLEYFEQAGDGRALDPLFTHQGWFFWGTEPSPRLLLHALEPLVEGAPDGSPPAAWLADRRVDFFVGEAWRRAAAARLAAHGCSDRPFAVLAPAARSSARWPPRKFAALARRLAAELGLHVLIEGGEADTAVLDAVAAHLGAAPGPPEPAPIADPFARPASPTGRERPEPPRIGIYRDPLGVLAALLERASLLVSNDSAPIHLAAATATPTLYFAHHEKLTHSHPGGPACWALFDGSRNRLARISVAQAMAALAEMARLRLVETAAPPPPA
jgi:ADP-heptose:LPS heptosyltransferase